MKFRQNRLDQVELQKPLTGANNSKGVRNPNILEPIKKPPKFSFDRML